ncbi:hypothetical protein Kpol_1036p92 [Vanderwaltozyma polyspora DSM 70294]|uniref:RING-type domain-containing protein n=1 Tax=Vanderwaltozyma polyspora (strain ATCC 22028 / DSM 70294 / BCRC 21397 / CBS 2163 / NBRC 10782 / NRRL Y-8283 / UCD 57-17) TaxID=436907 RepID=A7TEN8_VANPO|nr:uncharacterized protein Kpol_1036p92 [Vanderwaltozyma polyspora DSM 70294]EDO19345.1 hypothetical protein Kpol_1036p92 [Vanderwaltozyma polyspora DSM 70294]
MNVDIEHVQLDFVKGNEDNICSLQVQNNIMCFALRTGELYLVDLETPSKVYGYVVPMLSEGDSSEVLVKIWMNPGGDLLFIKTNFAKYYVCDVSKIFVSGKTDVKKDNSESLILIRKLSKKGCNLKSVCWCDSDSLLLGDIEGHVYYLTLNSHDRSKNTLTIVAKCSDRIDGISWSSNGSCVIASGNKLMYWKTISNDPIKTLKENPQPTESEEFECLTKDVGNRFSSTKDQFACIMSDVIVFGKTVPQNNGKILQNANVLLNVELSESTSTVRDVSLTDFYLILLRGSSLIVVNQLNNEVVFQESTWGKDNERIVGLEADYSQSPPTYWCYSSSNIYEIILEKESQSVWKLLCEQKRIDKALELKDLEPWQRDTILDFKANDLFDEEKFLEAAHYYGLTSCESFSAVVLKLMKTTNNVDSLQIFLTQKLEQLDKNDDVQKLLLSSWILWTYLKKMNIIDKKIDSERVTTHLDLLKEEMQTLKYSLNLFLEKYKTSLEKSLVYQMLETQNRITELLYFANLLQDRHFILDYWIKQENWYESLKVLLQLQDAELIYKYASVLLVNLPETTIRTWMSLKSIDPVKLIPSILTYYSHYSKSSAVQKAETIKENFGLTYLKWYIKENNTKDTILYNTILYMMITGLRSSKKRPEKEEQIVQFLSMYPERYDTNFILRLSLKFETLVVSIFLYSKLELYEDAVDLALENGMTDHAKKVIENIELEYNPKLTKKLWKNVAKSILNDAAGSQDIKHTISQIITESNGILEIKDLLPLFEQFTTIANVKDELIRSLEKHGQSMAQIAEETKLSMKMKQDILKDIEDFKERYEILEPGSSCDRCHKVLQTKKFFVFPCGHNFHSNCLLSELVGSNDIIIKSQVDSLQRKLLKSNSKTHTDELDSLLAKKCPLCSDILINKIDGGVLDNDQEMESWAI